MGITVFDVAPIPSNEDDRQRAVEASGALNVSNDPGLLHIVEEARKVFNVSMAAVSIVYRDWQFLIAAAGLPGGPYSRRTSFCGHVIQSTDPVLCIPDTMTDPRFSENPVAQGNLVRFYAGAPLIDGNGLPLGALCVFDMQPRQRLPGSEEGRLKAMAADVVRRLEALRTGGGT